jgi:hypothetical protein
VEIISLGVVHQLAKGIAEEVISVFWGVNCRRQIGIIHLCFEGLLKLQTTFTSYYCSVYTIHQRFKS